MRNRVFPWAMMTALAPKTTEAFGRMLAKGEDTSLAKKSRKERARMLTLARQEELRNNPKPPKKRGKKRK